MGHWPLEFDVLEPGPSNSTIHSKKGPDVPSGPLLFDVFFWARRGSLAFGFRRLGAWPVQFNHSFKKGPDVPSGPLLFDVFFGPGVGHWPFAFDVLGPGPTNSKTDAAIR